MRGKRLLCMLVICGLSSVACSKASTGSDGGARRLGAGEVSSISVNKATLADTGDLSALKRRGVLRVLVAGTGEEFLPRRTMPASADRELAREFARRLGVSVQFVLVPSHAKLLPLLAQGKGDLVAAQLTVTETRRKLVAFSRPLRTVSELVVGRRGDPALPHKIADLAGREVHVRPSSSYAETLRQVSQKVSVKLVGVDERQDAEAIVYDVGMGKRSLTVVDSHIFKAIQAYNDKVLSLFPIAKGRKIAWALRKGNPALKWAIDAFLVERALSAHTEEASTGGLPAVRRRGALRVLTRNNPITYFIHRGQQFGFDYELIRRAAQKLKLRLEMVVPPSRADLIPWLLSGKGDVIAASMTITDRRKEKVAFSRPYLKVREIVVQRAAAPRLKGLADLKGKTIHVRKSSSYYSTLLSLRPKYGPFEIVPASEKVETETLIDQVAKGKIPLTVADSHILKSELKFRDDVVGAFPLSGEKEIAFAVRKGNGKLQAALDAFVKADYRGVAYNMATRRYFESTKMLAKARRRVSKGGALSPYDDLIKKFAAEYHLDWRLLVAQCFRESRFDPKAKSWAGAIGLFQLMPKTGAALGFPELEKPQQGTHAGIKYLHRLLNKLDPQIKLKHRLRFALAAYNAGLGHLKDARRLAAEMGLNPNKWFGHVEKAMLKLSDPRYYKRARYGYCRGTEPVKYVSKIQNLYDNYVKIRR